MIVKKVGDMSRFNAMLCILPLPLYLLYIKKYSLIILYTFYHHFMAKCQKGLLVLIPFFFIVIFDILLTPTLCGKISVEFYFYYYVFDIFLCCCFLLFFDIFIKIFGFL